VSDLSFSDEPELTNWQKAGCVIYALFGCFVILLSGMVATLGGCPAFASPSCVPLNERFLDFVFPVTSVVVIGAGFGLLKFFKRGK
jgi:fumarate reductase subunit D